MAVYVSLSFLSFYSVLPNLSPGSDEVRPLDRYTPCSCFGTNTPKIRFTNVYARIIDTLSRSVLAQDASPDLEFPCLVTGDFNIHNHIVDRLEVISSSEERASGPNFDRVTDLAFTLLNNVGVYTGFPLAGWYRLSVLHQAFAMSLLVPVCFPWDSSSLTSTGSAQVPIMITHSAPTTDLPPRPMWDKAEWHALK